ncbi:MAG: ArsC/Spx/MgsR family protein [Nocardioides sp.]
MEVWHNPACSKSRAAVAALDAAGVTYVVRRYLDDPPTPAELADVLAALELEPWELARGREVAEAGLDLPRDAEHRTAWVEALAAHPRAIQRPMLVARDGTVVVGRDEEAVARAVAAER